MTTKNILIVVLFIAGLAFFYLVLTLPRHNLGLALVFLGLAFGSFGTALVLLRDRNTRRDF